MHSPVAGPSPPTTSHPNPHRHWEEADSLVPETPVRNFNVQSPAYPQGNVYRAQLSMYASHFLSTWGARGWEFTVALLMLQIYPSSLLLVSVFGLVDAAVVTMFSPLIGKYIDHTERLTAATRMYLLQNFTVAVSAGSGLVLLWRGVDAPRTAVYWIFVVLSIITGALSSLGATGASLSVEREWTKALSENNSEQLATMNSTMKRIDLTCLIASPIFVGLLMSWKMDAAVIALVAWNLISWFPECWLLRRAYDASPALAAPRTSDAVCGDHEKHNAKMTQQIHSMTSGWRLYALQSAVLAALSLALLYLTVMSFGTLMTAFLKWKGMKETELSIYRGLGALSGIAATFFFPFFHARFSVMAIGAVAVWSQFLCLAVGALPLLLQSISHMLHSDNESHNSSNESHNSTTMSEMVSARVLVLGLVLSRCGLWCFDLTVNQIIQETTADGNLGSINGVQSSVQSLCQMLMYIAGVVVWQPERFAFLIFGSLCVVGSAALMFSVYAIVQRRSRYTLVAESGSFSP